MTEDKSNTASVPRHVAIVMDGNGRWAQRRGLPRPLGHREGVKAVRRTVEECGRRGVGVLTLFAFSSENWRRPRSEVVTLMDLFTSTINSELDELVDNDVRLRFIGDRSGFPTRLQGLMEKGEARTAGNQGLNLVIAANYGGRWDIADGARRLAQRVAAGELAPEDIDAARLGGEVALTGLPDPDLFIRTGGEQRISNFLLWQMAYTELYFCDTLWPDFGAADLDQAFGDFAKRQRRFGRTGDQVLASSREANA